VTIEICNVKAGPFDEPDKLYEATLEVKGVPGVHRRAYYDAVLWASDREIYATIDGVRVGGVVKDVLLAGYIYDLKLERDWWRDLAVSTASEHAAANLRRLAADQRLTEDERRFLLSEASWTEEIGNMVIRGARDSAHGEFRLREYIHDGEARNAKLRAITDKL
jgi:hypothetical protein